MLSHRPIPQGDVIDSVTWSHSTDELVIQFKVCIADVEQVYLPQIDQILDVSHSAIIKIP